MAVPKKKVSLTKRKLNLFLYKNLKYNYYTHCKICFIILKYNQTCLFCSKSHK